VSTFTDAEITYLASQRLGRLATISPTGRLANNPVAYFIEADGGWIDIGGVMMDRTLKYRNVGADGRVSFVVDDIKSLDPWQVRGIEMRGRAEVLTLAAPLKPHQRPEIIRIYPQRILSWGIEEGPLRMFARDVPVTV
jgi:pyridoxamine 5'-phosphate oxidase family protein